MPSAAFFPAQAVLLSRVMDVFTLEGDAMVDRGNFFALMFVVMAGSALVCYFAMGWAVSRIAQVRPSLFSPVFHRCQLD